MNQMLKNQNSPWVSLMLLLGLMLGCTFVLQYGAVMLGKLFLGLSLADKADMTSGNLYFLYFMLCVGLIGTFLLPALILQRMERAFIYFPAEDTKPLFFVLVALFLCAFSPIMSLISAWNAGLALPESLYALENWMRTKEDEMAILTERIVMVNSWTLLAINVLVMAVVPAVAEEFFFRGSLMRIVQRMVNNYHITIWLTAIIFSFIHFQFYGFFPRMILGAFFGYMLVWTKNIWVPVLGHFVNNVTVTIVAFYYTRQGKTFEDLQSYDSYSIFVYLGSILLTIAIGYVFYIKSKGKEINYGEGLDEN